MSIWFSDGLERSLASKAIAARREMDGERRAGYLAALSDLAVEFGVDLPGAVHWTERPPILGRELIIEGEPIGLPAWVE